MGILKLGVFLVHGFCFFWLFFIGPKEFVILGVIL